MIGLIVGFGYHVLVIISKLTVHLNLKDYIYSIGCEV